MKATICRPTCVQIIWDTYRAFPTVSIMKVSSRIRFETSRFITVNSKVQHHPKRRSTLPPGETEQIACLQLVQNSIQQSAGFVVHIYVEANTEVTAAHERLNGPAVAPLLQRDAWPFSTPFTRSHCPCATWQ